MRRDPPWAAIEVFFCALGVTAAIGLWRRALAAIEWVWP